MPTLDIVDGQLEDIKLNEDSAIPPAELAIKLSVAISLKRIADEICGSNEHNEALKTDERS